MNGTPSVTARERDTIMQALAAGVVPRQGLRHIQVGRAAEVAALIGDIDRISDDGATVRFIIGEYGAGKTFFSISSGSSHSKRSWSRSRRTSHPTAGSMAVTARRAGSMPKPSRTCRLGRSPTAERWRASWNGS